MEVTVHSEFLRESKAARILTWRAEYFLLIIESGGFRK